MSSSREYIVDAFAFIFHFLYDRFLVFLSQIEERAWIKDVSGIEKLLHLIVHLHIVVSYDSFIEVGTDHEECLSRTFQCTSFFNHLRGDSI